MPPSARSSNDPIGVLIEPGQTLRWVNEANVHTSTAYHPDNDGHALRIPEAAESWDSGYLVEPGDQFEVTLTVEGVYDYFCTPHEMAVMVGRIIVDRPSGPGTLPLDYFQGDSARLARRSGGRHRPRSQPLRSSRESVLCGRPFDNSPRGRRCHVPVGQCYQGRLMRQSSPSRGFGP
jgi:plastocyanin